MLPTRKYSLSYALLALMLAVAHGYTSASGQQAAPSSSGETWAVVIGISRYPKLPGGQQLQFAERDAAAFAAALTANGIGPQRVKLLAGAQATAAAIKDAIGNWLAKSAREPDTAYIFFSGHGMVENEFGESYLLGSDSDAQNPYATAISITELTHAFSRRLRAGQVIVIADAVRRDLFDPNSAGASSAKAFVESMGRLAESRSGLAAILASGPGEFSREGQRWGGHGVFSKHLIDGLAGAADRNSDGNVSWEEIFSFISSHLSADTSNKQNPWRSPTLAGEFVVASLAPPERVTSEAPFSAVARKPIVRPTPDAADTRAESPAPHQPRLEKDPDRALRSAGTPHASDKVEVSGAGPEPGETTVPGAKTVSPPETTVTVAPPPSSFETAASPLPKAAAPPVIYVPLEPGFPEDLANSIEARIEPVALPEPPKPVFSLPTLPEVRETRSVNRPESIVASVPVDTASRPPTPLLLQLEAAIEAGNLLEPAGRSAWDIYRQLAGEEAASSEMTRIKPALADALSRSGLVILTGDIRSDNIGEKVEDFRLAGQLFSRARAVMAGGSQFAALEKLSAAYALLALQFYDEAEKSLLSLQSEGLAPVENALGMVYAGRFDSWRAERAFLRAATLAPDWASPHYNLALLHRGSNADAALKALERAAELSSGNAVILAALGDQYFGKEDWQKAADAYRRATAVNPADDTLHTKLGHALYSQGLRDEANKEYEKARELRGKQP